VRKIIIAVIAVPALFWMAWISFPVSSMQAVIEDSVSSGPLRIEVRGLKKGLFYTVDINMLTLRTRQNDFVSFDNIHGRINPLNFLLLKLEVSAHGYLRKGNVSGHVTFTRNTINGDIHFLKISLSDLEFLKHAGIRGTGTVDGNFMLGDSADRLEFIAKDANFEPADFSGVRVPLNFFHTISGALGIQGNAVHITSVSLEGKDMYAKLKGSIRDGVMDMTMEIMPGKSYADNPLVIAGLEPYKISPGYYSMPVKRGLQDIF